MGLNKSKMKCFFPEGTEHQWSPMLCCFHSCCCRHNVRQTYDFVVPMESCKTPSVILGVGAVESAFLIQVMHSSAIFQSPPISIVFYCSCDKVYHQQEVGFLLYLLTLLGQIVIWLNKPNPLDWNWLCTVINDNNWQLQNCPLRHQQPVCQTIWNDVWSDKITWCHNAQDQLGQSEYRSFSCIAGYSVSDAISSNLCWYIYCHYLQ